MLHPILEIPLWRLALAALSLGVLLAIARRFRLGVAKTAIVVSLRGTAQLFAVGYALAAIFTIQRPELVLATLLVMLGVAARTSIGRLSRPVRGIGWLAGAALGAGTGLGLLFMTVAVVRPSPFYDPQYVIPFAGMLLGNAMNGASVAGERFQEDFVSCLGEIEMRLALGFAGPDAVHPLLARALRASLIPTFNSFAVAGIVQIPGMMTGQILSGVRPFVAVEYQILIFLLIMGSTASSTLLFLLLLRSRYLTPTHQLRSNLLR